MIALVMFKEQFLPVGLDCIISEKSWVIDQGVLTS